MADAGRKSATNVEKKFRTTHSEFPTPLIKAFFKGVQQIKASSNVKGGKSSAS
jgi:hypothetical protein